MYLDHGDQAMARKSNQKNAYKTTQLRLTNIETTQLNSPVYPVNTFIVCACSTFNCGGGKVKKSQEIEEKKKQ
jgi:hypothetical protein